MSSPKVVNYSLKQGKQDWEEFMRTLNTRLNGCHCLQLREKVEPGDPEAWFRGHPKSSYELLPSLQRHPKFQETGAAKLAAVELDLFREFSCRAKELHGVLDDDWDILFAMQHYGVPTRLLDWTESFAVALYFAVLGIEEARKNEEFRGGLREDQDGEWTIPPPSIWVLNPYMLNDNPRWKPTGGWPLKDPWLLRPKDLGYDKKTNSLSTYSDLLLRGGMPWKRPVAVSPVQRNARLHAQRAWFTIHGNDSKPLGKSNASKEYVREVILPFTAIREAKNFLRLAGIDHYLLFPDLPSLSLHISQKRGLISPLDAERKMLARM